MILSLPRSPFPMRRTPAALPGGPGRTRRSRGSGFVPGLLIVTLGGLALSAPARAESGKTPLALACYAANRAELRQARQLVRSLRTFGGRYAKAPVSVFMPDSLKQAALPTLKDLAADGADLRASLTPRDAASIPAAGKVYAAGLAELIYASRAEELVWVDPGSLLLQEPRALLLPAEKDFGYRPSDFATACSPADSAPSTYWRMLYGIASVGPHHDAVVRTAVDQVSIRACFNDGLVVVRPAVGLLQSWSDTFTRVSSNNQILDLCQQDRARLNALHESALACAVTLKSPEARWVELGDRVSYPLFLWPRIPSAHRAGSLDEIVTLRCGGYFQDPSWKEHLPGSKKLTDWLQQNLP